jgi:hypothetical protein
MRKVTFAIVGAIFTVASLAISTPASADDPEFECYKPGWFCAWIDASYEGSMYGWTGNDAVYDIFQDNAFSSFYNNGTTGMVVRVYQHFYGTGEYLLCLPQGARLHYNAEINDRASSHYWRWGC